MSLPDTQGLRLISSGIAFWKAAKLLHEDDPQSLAWAPCFVNLGFAIELGLEGCADKGCQTQSKKPWAMIW